MVLPLTYTRPQRVVKRSNSDTSIGTRTDDDGEKHRPSNDSLGSGRSDASTGIPDSLAFDRILNGGTCPPMTIRDFMNYLIYIEHSAENLQFFLWFKDYVGRFEQASPSEKVLAPEWTQAMQNDAVARVRKDHADKIRREPEGTVIFKGTDFEKKKAYDDALASAPSKVDVNESTFSLPPRTPSSVRDHEATEVASTVAASNFATSFKSQASDAFQSAGAKQPCRWPMMPDLNRFLNQSDNGATVTIQPFREEINRVIATYIMDGAPRQLNLSAWEQKVAVQALSYTTNPSALQALSKTIESTLRHQAHPNFVRWSICNGNPPRVFFARFLGVFLIVTGFVVAIVLTLSSVGRGYRALAAIAWVLGISTLVAAYKGMCVVLHGLHHRHVRPWELFEQDGEDLDGFGSSKSAKGSFESFESCNSYEDEPWVVKYEKRNIVRKVFDREIWIEEPALRQIQDTIFIQALIAGVLIGGILTIIFVLVPGGKFF